jgi:hypothetical protein
MDDAYCLFVTVSCMLTLILPSAAQPLFALLAFALAVTALISAGRERPARPTQPRRGGVPGP